MEFTRDRTNTAKGVAICLMFIHHLYGFGDRLLNDNTYIPLIPLIDVESYIADFGNICVSMFLFLSGYGMYLGYCRAKNKTALHYVIVKLRNFYFTYWRYFIVFIPIGLFFFQHVTLWKSSQSRYSAEPELFFQNLMGWDATYNAEWWFVRMFVIIVLTLFPLYVSLAQKNSVWLMVTSLLLSYLGSDGSWGVDPWGTFGFMVWQPSFALGILAARLRFFSSALVQFMDSRHGLFYAVGLSICFLFRLLIDGIEYDFLVAPIFIYLSIRLVERLQIQPVFSYLGIHSFALWLTHSFFCYYYFQDLIYAPRWSPLIFALLVVLSLASVLLVEGGMAKVTQLAQPYREQVEQRYFNNGA